MRAALSLLDRTKFASDYTSWHDRPAHSSQQRPAAVFSVRHAYVPMARLKVTGCSLLNAFIVCMRRAKQNAASRSQADTFRSTAIYPGFVAVGWSKT